MKRISCIIFDLDGTLAQTNELIFSTFNHVAEKYTNKVYSPEEITAMFGPPEEVTIEKLVGAERVDEAMDDFYSFYETHHPRLADAYQGVREVLEFLKGRGIMLAVFTGKGSRTALITLEKIGLKDYFDIIITGHDVTNHKPSSEGIQKVMKRFHLRPDEVLMVGDSVADVKAAHEAGVSFAAVLWDSYSKDTVMQMDVDFCFHSVREFSDWIRTVITNHGERSN